MENFVQKTMFFLWLELLALFAAAAPYGQGVLHVLRNDKKLALSSGQ